jgi:hypothetical protein
MSQQLTRLARQRESVYNPAKIACGGSDYPAVYSGGTVLVYKRRGANSGQL